MLLEALVAATCLSGGSGCGEATSAYYQQSHELQALSKKAEKMGKEITDDHKWIVFVFTPIAAAVSKQPAKINMYKGTVMNVDIFKSSIGLQWNY